MSAVVESFGESQGAPAPMAVGDASRAVSFDCARTVSLTVFFGHVRALAATLPDVPCAINLCEDRYRFLVAFCAVAARGQTTLLPPSRTRAAIDEVRAQHPDSYCIGDGDPCGCDLPPVALLPHYVRLPAVLPVLDGDVPVIDDAALVAIGYTSGSTGRPKPNPKTWGSFRTSTRQNLDALAHLWPQDAPLRVVATVPPQHMYGMETSVLLPLLADASVHVARPFFPDDVAGALREADGHRLLVTTPVHLRALIASGVALPPLAGIVTATAPLTDTLAAEAEARFGCEVRELFGSTETCVIASRRTATETFWTPYAGVRVVPQPDGALVHAAHLDAPVPLADLVELDVDGRFRLCGRQADMIEIAGKRASLGDLTRRLLAIPGVDDGVVLQLDTPDATGVRRIAALVVAPHLHADDVRAALRLGVDAVFLPRPLRLVASLPRNETGKLPRQALLALLAREDG